MRRSRAVRICSVGIVATAIFGLVAATIPVHATASADMSPVYKVLLYDIYQCYTSSAFKSSTTISELTHSTSAIDKILDKPNIKVTIPTDSVGTLTGNAGKEMSCRDLLDGKNTWFHGDSSGIIKNADAIPTRSSNSQEVADFLTKFGYEEDPNATQENCFRIAYDYEYSFTGTFFGAGDIHETDVRYTDYLCGEVDPDTQRIKPNGLSVKKSSAGTDIVQWEIKDDGSRVQLDCNTTWFGDGGCSDFKLSDYGSKTWADFQYDIYAHLYWQNGSKTYTIENCDTSSPMCPKNTYTYTIKELEDKPIDENNSDQRTLKQPPSEASKSLINLLSGSESIPKIDINDVARMYITYAINYYAVTQVCGLNDVQVTKYTAPKNNKGYGAIEYIKNEAGEQCYVYSTKNDDKSVNGFTEISTVAGYFIGKDNIDFPGIIAWLLGYTGSVDKNFLTTDAEVAPELDPDDPSLTGGNPTKEQNCYNSTSLGWVLCPVLEMTTDAIKSIYGMIEDNLEITTGIIGSSGGTGTYQGWQVFQNFANIAVIVLLLVVIFSQVTGIGIDNYGIKKTLPKIIIAAILINLSFIVCQTSVDLSNILGYNLKSMLDGFAGAFGDTPPSVGDFAEQVGNTIVTGAGIGVAGVALAFTWSLWLIPLLLAILGILISIIFFFIIISVRKALVIVFVVIAPLAIAGYMLPNTKKWFDKWFKIFGALLLVFPICGLLMGAGTYISALLLSAVHEDGDFLYYLVAMLMQIAPFFFIPTILKNSMDDLGKIGAKISGAGKSVGKAAKKGIGSTEVVKDAQRQMNLAADTQRSRRLAGLSKRLGNPQFMQRRLGAVNQRIAAANAINSKETSWADEGRMRANEDALRLKESEEAIADEMAIIKNGEMFDPYDSSVTHKKFDAEDGKLLYQMSKYARAQGNHRRADALIDLAAKNGKAAAQFQQALRADTGHTLSRETALRMTSDNNKKIFQSTDGLSFQYAREVANGDAAAKGQNTVGAWMMRGENIHKAIEKNINNPEAFASQSLAVLETLNTDVVSDGHGGTMSIMDSLRAVDAAKSTNYVVELEHLAASASERTSDVSKSAQYNTMSHGQVSKEREIQNAQIKAQEKTASTLESINNELKKKRKKKK